MDFLGSDKGVADSNIEGQGVGLFAVPGHLCDTQPHNVANMADDFRVCFCHLTYQLAFPLVLCQFPSVNLSVAAIDVLWPRLAVRCS